MKQRDWDERYNRDGLLYGEAPNDFLREVMHRLPHGRTLCLGAGEGRNAVFLAGHFGPVTAVDLSAVGLRKAEKLAKERGVELQTEVADLMEFSFGEGWSVITSIWAHVPPPVRERVHSQVIHALSPGGAFVLESYTPAQIGRGTGGPPNPALTTNLAELEQQLQGLELVIGREIEREVSEGELHNGASCVVQLLAVKPS